jgi:hypothetical protein
MKQKYGIGILIGAGLALWLVFGMTLLAVNHPFSPGSVLFPIQRVSERLYIGLTFNKAGKAEIALKLAERRLVELARADQPEQVERSAEAFSQALAESEQCIQAAPQTWQSYLQGRSDKFMQQARVVVLALEPYREAAAVSALFKLFQIELSAPADPLRSRLQPQLLIPWRFPSWVSRSSTILSSWKAVTSWNATNAIRPGSTPGFQTAAKAATNIPPRSTQNTSRESAWTAMMSSAGGRPSSTTSWPWNACPAMQRISRTRPSTACIIPASATCAISTCRTGQYTNTIITR